MAAILRQIVAGPRARHPEAGLDLCYVTDYIIATSGPSSTYPRRAYRNPLDRLVAFLDEKHGTEWAIWEFRAEGTGYPDEEVYNRIRHYPFPDHHPPPFRLIPMILASMRNWLHGGASEGGRVHKTKDGEVKITSDVRDSSGEPLVVDGVAEGERKKERVVVVHCKAGKGRSGTASCSYLIAEEGWAKEDALNQFTSRRMRPGFGNGVSIPSQVRWIGYVDRWAKKGQKKYRDRPVEVTEIHAWGLRTGVKIEIAGFVDEGKKIKVLHTFKKDEREIIEGNPPDTSLTDTVWEMAGYPPKRDEDDGADADVKVAGNEKRKSFLKRQGTNMLEKLSSPTAHEKVEKIKSKTTSAITPPTAASSDSEPGGMAVILRPKSPVLVPSCDVNISVERRNSSSKSLGFTMVSSVAHVWFNTYFEGNGPEQDGKPNESGVFSINWDAMDGIKGSSRKGTRAFDKISVVWRVSTDGQGSGEDIREPESGEQIPESKAADWHGDSTVEKEKDLGLRITSPDSEEVSRASSLKGEMSTSKPAHQDQDNEDGESLKGVKTGGPDGQELSKDTATGEK